MSFTVCLYYGTAQIKLEKQSCVVIPQDMSNFSRDHLFKCMQNYLLKNAHDKFCVSTLCVQIEAPHECISEY